MLNYLFQMLVAYLKTDPRDYFWAQATIDDGRTLIVAWGFSEESAKKNLLNHRNKDVLTHPNGILKVVISNDVDIIPDEVVRWVSDHLGFPMPVKDSSNNQTS